MVYYISWWESRKTKSLPLFRRSNTENKMKTKNGHDVIVHEWDGKGTYCIKGSVLIPGKQPKYHIWDKQGRTYFFTESGYDLDLTQDSKKDIL